LHLGGGLQSDLAAVRPELKNSSFHFTFFSIEPQRGHFVRAIPIGTIMRLCFGHSTKRTCRIVKTS